MPKCPIDIFSVELGHFGENAQSRDLSLSQPFLDILATMAYNIHMNRIL